MTRSLLFACLLALGLVAYAPAPSRAADLSGDYDCTGSNGNGTDYHGTVTISKAGECYRLTWKIANQTHEGLGLVQGNVLAVIWAVKEGNGAGQAAGVVAYKILKDGTLVGRWTQLVDRPAVLDETLTPAK